MRVEQIDAVVRIHVPAFNGYLNTRIGDAYLKKMFTWFVGYKDAVALCAMDESGAVVGYVIGAIVFPRSYAAALQRHVMTTAVVGILTHWRVILHPHLRQAVLRRLGIARGPRRSGPTLSEPAISLVGIGVTPTSSGQGIGKQLIKEFEILAKGRGFRSMCLSVYAKNVVARRLYEGMGWQPGPEPKNALTAMYYTKT